MQRANWRKQQECEGSELSLCSQTNSLARHSFIDGDGRRATPGSETEDFIIHSITTSQTIGIVPVPWASIPR